MATVLRFPIRLTIRLIAFALLTALQGQDWLRTGPPGAFITALTISPTDTSTVYAGTYGAGVFVTRDRGANWVPVNEGFPLLDDSTVGIPPGTSTFWLHEFYPVTLLRSAPSNSSHIYAGTKGAGVFQSFDNGKTWDTTQEGLPFGAIPVDLWIDPQDASFVLSAMDYPNGGLFKSLDGGLTWEIVDGVPSGSTYQITSIVNEPDNPEIIYVGFMSAGEPELPWGLLRSPDRGEQWDIVFRDMPLFDLKIDPQEPKKLWGIGYTGLLQWMLFLSTDGGSSWAAFPDGSDPWVWVGMLYADHDWNLYTSEAYEPPWETPVVRKIEDEDTWMTLPISLPSSPMGIRNGYGPNMAANPLRSETIYFGTRPGVYRSDNGGQTAEIFPHGMTNTYTNDVEVNPQNPSVVYAGGSQGLWKSEDGGNSWIPLNTSRVTVVAIDPGHPDTLYWGGEGLERSYDGGKTWEDIYGDWYAQITSIEVHPDDSNVLFVGVYPSSLYKTENWGDEWELSYAADFGSFSIRDIAIDKSNPEIMYFGSAGNMTNHGFYRSVDGGSSWSKVSDPGQVTSISIHPVYPETIYVAADGHINVSGNRGETFEQVHIEQQTGWISKIFIDSSAPSNLLITTMSGVFYSSIDGKSWDLLAGPYHPRVRDLGYSPLYKKIYLATHGDGVWVADGISLGLSDTGNDHLIPGTMGLLPPYPNPFNTSVLIPFFLSEKTTVSLAIYDIEGKLVANLADRSFPPGTNSLRWNGLTRNGVAAASGVYVIRFHSRQFEAAQKLLLLR